MNISAFFQIFALADIDAKLGDMYWSPIEVARINDWVVRAAVFYGEYHWHHHNDDEFFYVYKGSIVIDTEHGPIAVSEGQGAVVPKGVQHKPKAEKRAVVLMLEPAHLKSIGE